MTTLQQRRWIARVVKVGLVGAAVLVVLAWFGEKRSRGPGFRMEHDERADTRGRGDGRGEGRGLEVRTAPAVEALAPGDVRVLNQDSSVNLILRGDDILAGLSPQMREKITQEIARSTGDDSSGFGAAVANVVRTTVASAIGTHAIYPLSDLRDIEYVDRRIIVVRHNGRRVDLLGNVKTDGEEISRTFPREEGEHFVEAVRARKRELRRRR